MLRVISFICRITRPEAGVILVLLSWREKNKQTNKMGLQGSEGEPGDSKYN